MKNRRNFFNERVVRRWKELPREVFKKQLDWCSNLVEKVVIHEGLHKIILESFPILTIFGIFPILAIFGIFSNFNHSMSLCFPGQQRCCWDQPGQSFSQVCLCQMCPFSFSVQCISSKPEKKKKKKNSNFPPRHFYTHTPFHTSHGAFPTGSTLL